MEKVDIVPLSKETLPQASKLIDEVFRPDVKDGVYPSKDLKSSLNLKSIPGFKTELTSLNYWVALDKGKVVGITGCYTLIYDEKEATWLGWYCVGPKARGKGVGKLLLDFIITKSKREGKKYLRLYTSKDPNEKRANEIYDKLGFRLIKDEKILKLIDNPKANPYTEELIFKELKLQPESITPCLI